MYIVYIRIHIMYTSRSVYYHTIFLDMSMHSHIIMSIGTGGMSYDEFQLLMERILVSVSLMQHFQKAQQYAQKRVRAHNAPQLQTTMSQIWFHILGWA